MHIIKVTQIFFQTIFEEIRNKDNDTIIVGGDWNVVQNHTLDTYNISNLNNKYSNEEINTFKINRDFCDPWRMFNPDCRQFTWRRINPIRQSRIDYFLVSQSLMAKTNECKIFPGYRTDHSAVSIKLTIKDTQRGKGYWKFNNKLIYDSDYVNKIKKCISETLLECREIEDYQYLWEFLKMKMRSLTIEHSVVKAKQKKEKTKSMERELLQLEQEFQRLPTNDLAELIRAKNCDIENERKIV